MGPDRMELVGMAGKITISGGRIAYCGTAISVSGESDTELHVSDVSIIKCNTAILERDPVGAIEALGIPPEIPRNEVREVVQLLLDARDKSDTEKESEIKKSSFWSLIQNASNGTTIVQGLVALTPPALSSLMSLI